MFTIQTPQSIDLLAHDPANPPPPIPAPYVRDPGDPHVPIVPLTPAQLKGETPPTRDEWARAGYAPNRYPVGAKEGAAPTTGDASNNYSAGAQEAAPAEPGHHGTIRFDHEGADVSKCRMIITRDDKVFTYIFNTGGNLVSAAYEDDKTREAKVAQDKAAKEAEDKAAAETEKERLAKLQATDPAAAETEKARIAKLQADNPHFAEVKATQLQAADPHTAEVKAAEAEKARLAAIDEHNRETAPANEFTI